MKCVVISIPLRIQKVANPTLKRKKVRGQFDPIHHLCSLFLSWSERGTVNPEVVGSISAKTQKTENPNLHGFEPHRPSSKGTKLLLQVIKAIIIHTV